MPHTEMHVRGTHRGDVCSECSVIVIIMTKKRSSGLVYLPDLRLKTRCLSSLKSPCCCCCCCCCSRLWVNETQGPRRGLSAAAAEAVAPSLPLPFCPNSSHLEEKDAHNKDGERTWRWVGVASCESKALLNSCKSTQMPDTHSATCACKESFHRGLLPHTRLLMFKKRG